MRIVPKSVNTVKKFRRDLKSRLNCLIPSSGDKRCCIISNGVNNTIGIGKAIAKSLTKGDIVCLFGNLGSGKTVLVKGIAEGLGIKRRKVVSPTFVLIQEYGSKIPFYHFDLYRLRTPRDIFSLGYEDYFYNDAITVIEWADRLGYLLPKEFLKIELFVKSDSQRLLQFEAVGARYKELLRHLIK